MMLVTVTLCTDRPNFEHHWRALLEERGIATRACHPGALAGATHQSAAVVFDGASSLFVEDGDELLSGVGFVRALDLVAAAVLPEDPRFDEVADVVGDLCAGLLGRGDGRTEALAGHLERRLERRKARRFELVGVSPREGEVLAILGDRRAVLVPRPLSNDDDGTEIEAIELIEGDTAAALRLTSGVSVLLRAADIGAGLVMPWSSGEAHASHAGSSNAGSSNAGSSNSGGRSNGPVPANGKSVAVSAVIPMDGVHLGARLRALRLQAGLTQAELARRTGIHRPNIARVEGGRHTPSLDTLTRLAEAIGVPATRVFSED